MFILELRKALKAKNSSTEIIRPENFLCLVQVNPSSLPPSLLSLLSSLSPLPPLSFPPHLYFNISGSLAGREWISWICGWPHENEAFLLLTWYMHAVNTVELLYSNTLK